MLLLSDFLPTFSVRKGVTRSRANNEASCDCLATLSGIAELYIAGDQRCHGSDFIGEFEVID
jgi:hypothetical protein